MTNNTAYRSAKAFIKDTVVLRLTVDDTELIEPKLGGYGSVTLNEDDWQLLSDEDQSRVVAKKWVEFVFEEGEDNIFGHFLTDAAGELIYVEMYPEGPFRVLRSGDTLRIRPKVIYKNEK